MSTEPIPVLNKWSVMREIVCKLFLFHILGTIRNLSPQLWELQHLTSLYLNDNNLARIPPDISKLQHLVYLDLSSNKLRSLPAELGDMHTLRELLLSNNYLRVLPYELGRLFQLQTLGEFSCYRTAILTIVVDQFYIQTFYRNSILFLIHSF